MTIQARVPQSLARCLELSWVCGFLRVHADAALFHRFSAERPLFPEPPPRFFVVLVLGISTISCGWTPRHVTVNWSALIACSLNAFRSKSLLHANRNRLMFVAA